MTERQNTVSVIFYERIYSLRNWVVKKPIISEMVNTTNDM